MFASRLESWPVTLALASDNPGSERRISFLPKRKEDWIMSWQLFKT